MCSYLTNKGSEDPHIWIIDGGAGGSTDYYTEIWSFDYDKNFVIMHTDESNITTHYYYLNWGWGNYNGVYLNLVPNRHG